MCLLFWLADNGQRIDWSRVAVTTPVAKVSVFSVIYL